jgi:RimJ/RimL family protein N-acetyltransferase
MPERFMRHDLSFEKVGLDHKELIFSWLGAPHVMEFWDNTQAHKDDILNFIDGRKHPSPYAGGKYMYWVAKAGHQPFALLMMIPNTIADDINALQRAHVSTIGTSYGIDYMIGDTDYLGKGYGASTLSRFVDFIRADIDPKADTFMIDPTTDNPRAKHVYMKAGFEYIADFVMMGTSSGAGKPHHFLVKKFAP